MRNADQLTEDIIQCQAKGQPDIRERYGTQGYDDYKRDIKYHLKFLSNALKYVSKGLFGSYIEWVKRLLMGLNISEEDIVTIFQCLKRVFESKAPGSVREILVDFMDAGLDLLDTDVSDIPSFLVDEFPLSDLANQYLELLLQSKPEEARQLIHDAVNRGVDVRDIYLQVLENVQLEVGRLWYANQLTVAQEHYITNLTQRVMNSLHSFIQPSERVNRTVVASCVPGELHDLGIRMVSDFFVLNGWKVYLTGANTPIPAIIKTIKDQKADLLAISITIPWHVIEAEKLIDEIRKDPQLKDIKIIVGGRVFSIDSQLWKRVGADGYAPNAQTAVETAKNLF
jgi:methanogenic corrinoid protein MtbC1